MGSERLFFGFRPDPRAQEQLLACSHALRSVVSAKRIRWVAPQNWHLTLVFLGQIALEQKVALMAAADQCLIPPFPVQLDRFGYWARPRVGVMVPSGELHPNHSQLVECLTHIALDAGINLRLRSYRPHLTLWRGPAVNPLPSLEKTICWTVDSFSLFVSERTDNGVRYTALQEWPLA